MAELLRSGSQAALLDDLRSTYAQRCGALCQALRESMPAGCEVCTAPPVHTQGARSSRLAHAVAWRRKQAVAGDDMMAAFANARAAALAKTLEALKKVAVFQGLSDSQLETLRDAMVQWRLRSTAHPKEREAVDWLLAQLDPAAFGLLNVKVPEQARLLVIEAQAVMGPQ